jgi:branched-chain amino acid transport system ATP-binding protein
MIEAVAAAVISPPLMCRDLTGGYEADAPVVSNVSLELLPGQIVGLLGPNGAGKTTLLRAICGLLPQTSGFVAVDGDDISTASTAVRSRHGLCMIPEGGGTFRSLTVAENLQLFGRKDQLVAGIEEALAVFPSLSGRLKTTSGQLSGGLQQQLALARCYIARPKVILVDEVSMGLAPMVIDQIFESLASLAREGISMLVVEQYVDRVLALADQVALLQHGRIVFNKPASAIDRDELAATYLAGSEAHA